MKTVEDAKAWAKDNALQLEVDLMDYCREHRGGAWFLREMPRLWGQP